MIGPALKPGNVILAIDPGISGGLAWCRSYSAEPNKVQAVKMPKEIKDLYKVMQEITNGQHAVCYIENVGFYRPGNSAPAAVKFGKHVGHLQMAIEALGIANVAVVPSKWMKEVLIEVPKEKGTRKHEIKEVMQKRYPHIKVTLALSDALGILTYAIDQEAEITPIMFGTSL